MRFSVLTILFSALLYAAVAPDAVVAEIDGKKYTAADVDKLISLYPAQIQNAVRANPARGLTQIMMLKQLSDMAVKDTLDQQSPYKEALEYQRLNALAQAEILVYRNKIGIPMEEQQKFYQDHPERYPQAKVRMIYIAFNPMADKGTGDMKLPAEAQAKAKVDGLRKEALSGADFGKLAKENSDDKASAAKDGDFGYIQKNSSYPDALKNAVFALKPGAVGEPVKQPNGYYLIRVEETKVQPFDEVRSQIEEELKQARFNDFMKGLESRFSVKIDNPTYFSPKPPPAQPQPAH